MIYKGLRHIAANRERPSRALITRRSWVQIPPPQPSDRQDGFSSCLSFSFPDEGAENHGISRLSGIRKFFVANSPGFTRRVCLRRCTARIVPMIFQKRPCRSVATDSRLLPFATSFGNRCSTSFAAGPPQKRSTSRGIRQPDIRESPPCPGPSERRRRFQTAHV